MIPPIALNRAAAGFWLALVLTGIGTGLGAAALSGLFTLMERLAWSDRGQGLVQAASQATAVHHILVLVGAGVVTGAGQLLLTRLPSGNSIDITAAIWFQAGRLPALRTLGSAVLSIVIVGMGTSLGREGAPKQSGAVLANLACDRIGIADDERRLIVACGAGAGMAAAYGVPLGGALFAVEVLRGALALRFVLPAVLTSLIATGVSWIFLVNQPLYVVPAYSSSVSGSLWALLAGPLIGLASVLFVRCVAWADRHKPTGAARVWLPAVMLGAVGMVSIPYPQLLGNGRDAAGLAFNGHIAPLLMLALVLLRPAATLACLRCGAPGGLFTPTLAVGALLGGVLGLPWTWLAPGVPPGLYALTGATAMIAATTQGPLSALVLTMELTGHVRAGIMPLLLAVVTATLVARSIEPRSIYDARLSDSQVRERQRARDDLPDRLPPT